MPIDYNEFAKKIKAKYPEYNDVDNYTLASKMVEKYPEYKGQVDLKKKDLTVSGSVKPSSERLSTTTTTKPTASSSSKSEIFKGYPGKENKEYKFENNMWYETKLSNATSYKTTNEISKSGAIISKTPTPNLNIKTSYVKITDPSRVAELNRHFKKSASTSSSEQIFTGYPGKEANEYKVGDNGVWMKRAQGKTSWSVVTNEGSIGALNRQFGKDIDPNKSNIQQIAAKNDELNNLNHKIDSYVTSSLIDDREGAVVSVLSKQFPQFKFEETQAGADRIIVSLKGSNRSEDKIEIMLDNWRDSEDSFEAKRLRDFMKERSAMADSRINLEEKEGYFINKETERRQAAIRGGMGERDFVQPELKINKDGSVSYATEPTTKPGETTMKDWEAKQQLMTARKEYIADKSSYMKSLKNSYERGDIDREQFGSAVAAIKVDDEEMKRHDNFINDVNIRRKDLVQSEKFQEDYIADVEAKLKSGEITQEQYDIEFKDKIAGINQRVEEKRSELKKDDRNIDVSLKAMNRALGENRLIQEQIGSTGGVIVYNFLKGATNVGRFAGMTPEDQDEFIRELTGIMTTEEWMSSKDRTFLQQAAMSTTSSLGAAATKFIPVVGQAAYAANLFSLGFFEMKDDLDNATYKNPETGKVEKLNIPNEQKLLMAASFGVVSYYLEKLGLDELLTGTAGKKLAMTVVKDVAKKIAKDSPKEFIENALISETKTRLQEAGVRVGVGMLTEGATESLQSLSNVSTKKIYDELNNKEYFNNKSGWEIASDIIYEGALATAGGGMVTGAITGAQLTTQQMRDAKYKDEINAMIAAAETEGANQAIITTLKAKVIKGELTGTEAKQIASNFTIIKSKVDQMPNNLSEQGKAASLDLMMEKDKLDKTIQGKDPNLVKPQKDRIAEIDKRLQEIAKENAVQKQTTSEVPLQPETGVSGEVAQGKPETGSQEVTQEGSQAQEVNQSKFVAEEATRLAQENISTEQRQSLVNRLYEDPVAYARENNTPGSPSEKFINSLEQQPAAKEKITVFRGVGNNVMSGDNSSTLWVAENEEVAKNYAGTSKDGTLNIESLEIDKPSNPIEMPYKLATDVRGSDIANNLRSIAAELKKSGKLPKENISKVLELISDFESKAGNNLELFTTKLNKPEANEAFSKAVQALGFDGVIQKEAAVRDGEMSNTYGIFKNTYANLLQDTQKQTNLAQDEKGKPKAGNRLFNEPLQAVAEIANRYFQRVFESQRPTFEGTTDFDVERAKRIAAAYEAMEDNPNDPEVRRAYEAMAKETIEQYQDFLDAGYVVEINNEEPYANSEEMIEDLRNNKRIRIFSTESGFGDTPITPKQRAENPLLATTEFTDVNGQPMLVNDLFRAVHDFFGHAELGNSFGPKGEENAWNVHARMYSPLARRAMTTETRGQNSYVNFSGVNEKVDKLREEAIKLREQGKVDEAAALVNQIYDEAKFAEQKIGLLPEEFSQVDEEDILQADTKDATNLQKALNALDKIEKDLDKFGKETLGINIPVALAKTIVKAVKALVKAGVTLEQAIKQIAAEYNLSDRDVKSLLSPTKVSEIDVNEVRAKARPGKRISKGLSVKTVAGKKVVEETEGLSIEYVKKNAPKAFISNANIIAKYPLVAGKKKFKTATTVEQAQEIYDVFVREVADNLNYLMDEFKPEYREISTLWYDGANAIANDFAEQFDVSPEQVAGIIASMSPQKDWYQNVRLAELVLMAYKDNPVMTKEMVDYQKGINEKGLYDGATSAGKKLKRAEADYKKSRTKANKEVLDKAKVKMQEAIEKADDVITMLNKYVGKNLNDVPAFVQPYMVRTYHEVNTTKDYNIVAPDGSIQGLAKNIDGEKSKVAWGSYVEIGKAVAIKNDGSQENITRSLGERHKIRNFYNNIIDPMSKDGDVTMDTHAIAAALLLPLSGNSTQVDQNFGGSGTSKSDTFGIKGLYYAYADAYALAAKEAGLLPRQVQSITWEAVRGLYTDTFKVNKAEVAKINNIWKDYQDGKITIDEAREQAKESAGGIKDPTWAGPVQAELGEGAGTQGVEGGRDGNERDTVGGADGGGVLTADTKDKTNLKKALDVLNKADDDLARFGRETLGINIPVATMRAIIKLAKVLVKTGITLQDAIIQAAEQKNVSKKDALNAIKFMVETINKPVEKVTVNKVTALKDQIRLEARAAREGAKSVSQAVKAITTFFKDKANQVNLTRAELKSVINIISSVKDQKTLDAAADKIYKIVSSAKSDVVEVNQMQALKSQIRLEAKAAREAKGDLNAKRKALTVAITGMVRQGKITAVQARSIINKVSRVNLDNPVMVDRLISYAERVFDRADYQETLSKAAKIRKSIKKAMKSKDIQAEVAGMAKKFSGVDPFMVDDIDQYIENAEKVLNAVRPVRDTAVPLRQAADIEAISEYTTAQFERQESNKKAELLALNKYLVEAGIVTDDMTAKEIQELIDIITAEEYEVEDAAKKLIFLKSRFNFMAGVIEQMIVNNRDIFTDEALDLTQRQRDLMREVLKFDIDKLSVKQAAQVLEAMDNFINNGITSGLEAVVKGYIGNENANKLAASGLKSRPIRMYWNKAVGRFFGEQFVSLPLLVERMFPGMKKGLKIMSDIGLTDLIRGVAKADREHKMIVKDYTSQDFYKGKGFMKAENVYERGMIAFLSRNLAGTKTEMRNEFLRRVKMIEESINALMAGSETERKMGEAYQKIYDKLKVDSQDLDIIKANAEKMNLDAVNWMTQQWAEKYSDLSDISLSVYNAILGSDTNYTPDRYKGLDESDIELDENLLQKGSAFMGGLEYTDKNKSGVLIETTRPKALPKGRFVSLDFDVNNFSSLKGAMIDIETAPAIRQVDGFIKSDGYKKIVNGDDRKILTRRINKYIIDVKGKNAFNRDTMRSVERLANFLGSLGVGKALGGLDQTVKQTAPVIINTLINAGRFDSLNFEMNAAINRSGMPIANRGIEAIAGVESVDALIDKKGATAAEIAKAVEKVSQMYMKALLSKPDVWVARSSFISYYKNYLKTNGMSTDIDWQTHEWNQEAMNYAQMMVDRQQNISDEKLAGSFMNSSDPWKSVTRKVILPFATFIINQKNRMHNDLIALFGRGAETSIEDKKKAARSLIGLSAEMLAYQGIAYFIKTMIYDNIAAWITGEDDEEEEKERSFFGIKMTKKEWNATKFPVKSLVSDVLSPFPLFDDAVVFGFDELMSNFPMISDEDIKKAIQDQNDARALKGQDPMDAEQEANLIKNLKDKNTYKVTFQKESLGRQYGVPGIAFDTYTELAEMAQLAYTGEFEDDMGFGPKKKYISKKDQELVKWTLLPMVLYSTGLVPKDAGVVSRKVVNTVKKRSISETKFKNTNELKTELGRKPKEWEESLVMNTTKKVPTLVEAIKFAERFGGLTESQGKEYAKLIEITGDYGYLDLKRIQEGETADQILKK